MEHATTWFYQLFHIDPRLDHVATAIFVALVLVLLTVLGGRALKKAKGDVLPEGKMSIRTLLELAVESLDNMVEGVMGHHGRHFLPLLGTIFIYIFVSNLIGVIPGFLPPTSNVNTNLGVAFIVFFATHFYGVKEHGAGYIKHFMGPIILLAPLLFVIEMISHVVRPLSLTVRLYGNINGDHIVLGIFSNIWHTLGLNIPEIGIPVIFLALGVFISFIQAFVFSLLSMIYISGAIAHDH